MTGLPDYVREAFAMPAPAWAISKDPEGHTYVKREYIALLLNDLVGESNWEWRPRQVEHKTITTTNKQGQTSTRDVWYAWGELTILGITRGGVGVHDGGPTYDPPKSAESSAFKRAASLFGIGLEFYFEGNPSWVIRDDVWRRFVTKAITDYHYPDEATVLWALGVPSRMLYGGSATDALQTIIEVATDQGWYHPKPSNAPQAPTAPQRVETPVTPTQNATADATALDEGLVATLASATSIAWGAFFDCNDGREFVSAWTSHYPTASEGGATGAMLITTEQAQALNMDIVAKHFVPKGKGTTDKRKFILAELMGAVNAEGKATTTAVTQHQRHWLYSLMRTAPMDGVAHLSALFDDWATARLQR